MKKLFVFLLCISFSGLAMCKEEKKAEKEEATITINMGKDEDSSADLRDSEQSGDCDEFMDDYEKWMERYIELLKKYKENPVGLASSPEYTEMSMELMEWSSKWSTLAIDCAKNPEYESRFKEIQEKAEKEMEALGFK